MRRLLGTAAVALAATILVGCTGPGSDSGAGGGTSFDGAAPEPAVPGGPEGAPADADADRQVVTTASATVAVEDPIGAAREVSELAESVGGWVEERIEQAAAVDGGAEGAVAELVVRVPAAELTEVLDELDDLGEVEHVSVSTTDVTATTVDLEARISALRTSVARLEALMDAAASTEALLAAEQALAERQQELESLQSRQERLAGQVEVSTLRVQLRPFGVVPAGGPDDFGDGVGTGWRALVEALSSSVVIVGVLLPWLLVAGLLATVVLVPIRWARRRARRRAAVVAPAPESPSPD